MIRQYSHHDIEKWAKYSGDRNRIHFDKAFAIENGLKDVIIQGMLILLDAKMMMVPLVNESSELNFYIKRPVPVNTDIAFSIKESPNKKNLAVAELNNLDEVCVTATILRQEPPKLNANIEQIRVSSEFIQMHLDLLQEYYPNITSNWLVMDTLLFCICFNQQKDDYFYRQSLKISQGDNYNKITTYHAAQKIFISERLLTCDDIQFSDINYSVEEKDIYVLEDSAYSTFNISAIEKNEIIFQSSIGCITKASD